MSAPYDPTTAIGAVRLLISDVHPEDDERRVFTDAEVTRFLGLSGNVVQVAASMALTVAAADQVQTLKVIRLMDLSVDGAAAGRALLEIAKRLTDDWTAQQGNAPAGTTVETKPFSFGVVSTDRGR